MSNKIYRHVYESTAEDVKVLKPHEATVLMIQTGKLSVIGRKLFNVLMFKAQQALWKARDAGEVKPVLFEAPLQDLLKIADAEDSTSDFRSVAKKYLREMVGTQVEWGKPDAKWQTSNDENQQPRWGVANLVSQVEMFKKDSDNRTWVQWALPPKMIVQIEDPQKFGYTQLSLSNMSKLSTYESLALYDICIRYRDNIHRDKNHGTSQKPPDWWHDALVPKLLIDKKTKLVKRRDWRKFKAEKLNDAVIEINSKTDIDIELKEERKGSGKEVTDVKFIVTKKPTVKPTIAPVNLELVQMGLSLDLSESQVDNLLGKYSEEQLKVGLLKLETRTKRADLGLIESPVGYVRKTLENLGVKPDALPSKVSRLSIASSMSQSKPIATEIQNTAPEVESLRTKFKIELLKLPAEEQIKFGSMAFEALQKAGITTPIIMRNLQDKKWIGTLQSKMIEVFALETYGENWATEQEVKTTNDE